MVEKHNFGNSIILHAIYIAQFFKATYMDFFKLDRRGVPRSNDAHEIYVLN